MRTRLAQRQSQIQKLSPQQIQLMKLLQIPVAMLDQRVQEELEANPALEEGAITERTDTLDQNTEDNTEDREDTYELDDYLSDYIEDDPVAYQSSGSYHSDDPEKTIPIAVEQSLNDHLERQLGLIDFEEESDELIALQVIGSIDDDGYLRRDPVSIVDDLMFSQNIFTTEEKVLETLRLIQTFDPPGIGARDLQECLLLQLQIKLDNWDEWEEEEPAAIEHAITIVRDYFDAFSKKHFEKLVRQLNITEEQLKEAMNVVLTLNPKPASGFSSGSISRTNQYVIPDFIIETRDGELNLRLNSRNAPELRISDHFRELLSAQKGGSTLAKSQKEAVQFIKQKVESARWFIDAIRQRQETLYKTMYAIMQYQYDYFMTGDERRLRPMILQDIADITGLDVSTVSRVANSKFVQTEYGTKSLKSFFSEAMQNAEGEEVSTLEIKDILTEVITKENKRKPLSDQKLSAILKEKGYKVARRTIAKYRDQLNIPKASLRKEL
jgi:RNA polymerase sigma-54 factor